jgi:hypothetical protein
MKRSFDQQQADKGGAGAAQPGCQQDQGRANLRSQLAGLRHRAAIRANRPARDSSSESTSSSPGCDEGSDGERRPEQAQAHAGPSAAGHSGAGHSGAGPQQRHHAAGAQYQEEEVEGEAGPTYPDAHASATCDSGTDVSVCSQGPASHGNWQRKYTGTSDTRAAVMSQLAGLKRKQAIKAGRIV